MNSHSICGYIYVTYMFIHMYIHLHTKQPCLIQKYSCVEDLWRQGCLLSTVFGVKVVCSIKDIWSRRFLVQKQFHLHF